MSRWQITVVVDEDDLRVSAAESAEDGNTDDYTIEGMIGQEMGWVGQSGIHIVDLKEIGE